MGSVDAISFENLIQEDQKLKVFNDTVPAGILIIRVDDGQVIFSNQFFHDALGADGAEVLGHSWADFFVNADQRQQLMMDFSVHDEVRNYEVELRRADGGSIWGLASMSEIPIEGEDLLLFAFIDITALKEAENEIRFLANHDQLTGLPTHRLFNDRLDKALARAKRDKTEVAVMFIDLDGFKAVNDTLGHDGGDLVLKEAGERLSAAVRDADTVARMGGDEFIIIAEQQNKAGASLVGARIIESLSKPFIAADGEARIGASVGIAFYPKDGETTESLVKAADGAMYEVKNSTKGAVSFV